MRSGADVALRGPQSPRRGFHLRKGPFSGLAGPRCGEDGVWSRTEARTHAVARLESVDCALETDRIHAGVELHTAS